MITDTSYPTPRCLDNDIEGRKMEFSYGENLGVGTLRGTRNGEVYCAKADAIGNGQRYLELEMGVNNMDEVVARCISQSPEPTNLLTCQFC